MKTRGFLYWLARLLGDVNSATSGSPKKIAQRGVNKAVGRKVISRVWWK